MYGFSTSEVRDNLANSIGYLRDHDLSLQRVLALALRVGYVLLMIPNKGEMHTVLP